MNKKLFKVLLITALLALVMGPTAVVAQSLTIGFQNATGIGISSNTIQINNILVDFVTTNPFDPSHPTITTVPYNVPFVFDPVTLHLIPNQGNVAPGNTCASLTVNASNAFTGSALSGAVISVTGSTVSGLTNSLGVASLSGLSSGSAQLTATASGFTSASRTLDLSCTSTNSAGISLSPTTGTGAVTASQVRIVLNWGQNPSDLDSHLTGPSATSTGLLTDTTNRFHVYYAARTADVAMLDVDDVTSFGPETVTISPPAGRTTLRPGLYRYSVFHFSGSATIPTSGASVTLTLGGQAPREFRAPAGTAPSSGSLWTVFELAVGSTGGITVYPVNTYLTGQSSSTVRYTETGYGDIERGVDFARLPPK